MFLVNGDRVCGSVFVFEVREWKGKLRKEQRGIDRQIRGLGFAVTVHSVRLSIDIYRQSLLI